MRDDRHDGTTRPTEGPGRRAALMIVAAITVALPSMAACGKDSASTTTGSGTTAPAQTAPPGSTKGTTGTTPGTAPGTTASTTPGTDVVDSSMPLTTLAVTTTAGPVPTLTTPSTVLPTLPPTTQAPTTTGRQPTTTAKPPPSTAPVSVANFAYAPATVTIKVGDSVKWTKGDSFDHTVTSDTGAFASPNPMGTTYTNPFAQPGTYKYHCEIHGPSMAGTVVVTA